MIDLRLGDCLDVMPTLAAQSFDAIIADIPYGTTACKWDTVIPFAPMWENLKRLAKSKAAIVLFGSQPFTSALVMSNAEMFRHGWVWDKKRTTGGANSDNAPMRAHEDIVVFGHNTVVYNPQMAEWTPEQIKQMRRHDFHVIAKGAMQYANNVAPGRHKKVENGKHPDTIIRIPALGSIDSERTGHPTQKPVALMEYLIRTYTNEGDAVLDFTMGSGTTMVACVNTGRNGTGIEKDAGYYAIAERRVQEAQAQVRMPQMV